MGMGGQGTGSGIGAILGGIAGSVLLPGVGTAIGATLGGGIGSLIGGAFDSGGPNDPRGKGDQNNPAATKAEPMNRTVSVPPPSYRHGVEPEFNFFSKFDEGGPVLPLPQFNKPVNSAGQTSMQQYFPNYVPTGPGTNGSPSWAQIAAATAPTLPPLQTGAPSVQATPFDPLTYGRTQPTTQPPPPAPAQNPVVNPTPVSTNPYPWPEMFGETGADFINGVWVARPVQGSSGYMGWGPGYSGSYGGYGADAGLAGLGAIGSSSFGDVAGITYAKGGKVESDDNRPAPLINRRIAPPVPMFQLNKRLELEDVDPYLFDRNLDPDRDSPSFGEIFRDLMEKDSNTRVRNSDQERRLDGMMYAEGGQVDPGQQGALYQETVKALQGRHPNPEPVLEAFIKVFGPAALNRLRMQIAAGIAGQVDTDPGLQNMSDGMSDSIPATVNGQQPARLSEGEFVVDAPTVAALGNGSTEAGIRQLEGMRQRIRQQAHGTTQQQNRVNPLAVLPR